MYGRQRKECPSYRHNRYYERYDGRLRLVASNENYDEYVCDVCAAKYWQFSAPEDQYPFQGKAGKGSERTTRVVHERDWGQD